MIGALGLGSLPREEIVAVNRTGAALVVGGMYSLDITGGDATSIDADSNLSNVVATATANLEGFLVVALQPTADKAVGKFLIRGVDQLLVDGTTDVAEGDRLIPQNASVNVIKATALVMPCALALEAQTANAGTLARCYFDGYTWKTKVPVS